MSETPDWMVWPLAAAVVALFGWFFWHVARSGIDWLVSTARTIENWPQTRRAMVEAEARAGGRFPFWYRAVRVSLILLVIGLAAFLILRLVG